jgi:hypothetical protein
MIYLKNLVHLNGKTSVMKRTHLKKYSAKKKEQWAEEKKEKEKMWNFFMEIWKERPHRSEVSDQWLGNEPLTIFFDHLLEKEKYPEIKYEKWNIALVTWSEHDAKGNGFPLPKHQQLIDEAREKWKELRDLSL